MARLSLGAFKDLKPAATPMPDLGVVTVTIGCASILLDAVETDQLAAELQRAAQQLRGESQDAAA
jgi:hypothetical protein